MLFEEDNEVRVLREAYADIIRELKLLTKEELILVLCWLIMDAAATLGILFALIIFHKPLLLDLFGRDIRDPFNLQQGWLLWAIIGFIVANTARFGTTFATKYFSKRWPHPKTNDSIDTGHEQDQWTGSPIVDSILVWLLMVALLLPPLIEEYVCRGYLTALLTKWLATTTVVVFTSFAIAYAHWHSEPLSHLFVGVIAFGLTYAKTRNLKSILAIHFLLVMGQCFVDFITFLRRSFSQGSMLTSAAKEVSYVFSLFLCLSLGRAWVWV